MNRALFAGGIAAACLTAFAAHAQTPPPAQKPAEQKPADATVSDVKVSGAREAVETSIDRRSYSVANDLNGKSGTLADVLRNVPSVQVDVEGKLSLRGDPNVTVLVDGKPNAMFSAATLAQILQAMPADQVDRIEVITNPSAEFKADGSAGIINLVLKKAKGAGRTGTARVNAQTTGSFGGSVLHGFNSDKTSFVDSLSYSHIRTGLTGVATREFNDPPGVATSTDIIGGRVDGDMFNGRVALDYDLSARTHLTASLFALRQDISQEMSDRYTVTSGAGVTSTIERPGVTDVSAQTVQADFNLRQKYGDAHDLNVRLTLSDSQNSNERFDLTPSVPFARQFVRDNPQQRASLSADFQKPLAGGTQLKAGYLLEHQDADMVQSGGSGPSPTAITPDPAQTSDFNDVEVHHQAYVTLQKKFDDLTVLGGLRGEAVDLDLNQRTLGLRNGQNYTKFYPTLHLSWDLGEGRKLTGSYSKRVQRPTASDLNPFLFIQGPTGGSQGNPNLRPQETNAFEVAFERRKGQASLLATAYYRASDNAFSTVIEDTGGGFLVNRRENLGRQTNTGVEVNLGNRLTPKMTYNLSFNAYYSTVGAQNLGFATERSSFAAFGRANLNWQVTPKDFIQVNVFANGKQLLPQGYALPSVSGNIGYRHTINDKLSWMVVVQDPFDSLKQTFVLDAPGIRSRQSVKASNRALSLTLVYNFAGKAPPSGFDFQPGGTGATAVP